jgi:hypothetical protein
LWDLTYNRRWQRWIARGRAATRDEVIEQGRWIVQQFGQRVDF